MHRFISETAKYGDLTRGPRIVNERVKKEMGKVLKEIQSGRFARQWIAENKVGRPNYQRLLKADLAHLIEKWAPHCARACPGSTSRAPDSQHRARSVTSAGRDSSH
jgi:ketol-acid reductoisomerase